MTFWTKPAYLNKRYCEAVNLCEKYRRLYEVRKDNRTLQSWKFHLSALLSLTALMDQVDGWL